MDSFGLILISNVRGHADFLTRVDSFFGLFGLGGVDFHFVDRVK